jgi:hypothetical protein
MKNSKAEVSIQKSEINLHIEELVLHGFAPGDRHRIADAVAKELARLISEQPFAAGKNIFLAQRDGGSFQIKNPAGAASVGGQIAGAVHAGIQL